MTASGANSLLRSCLFAPASMATRNGCFDINLTPIVRSASAGVVPHVGRQSSSVQRDQSVPEDLERWKRPGGDGALKQQAAVVVRQQFQAFDLVALDRALPAQQGRAIIDLAFEDVLARVIPAAG